jgi:HEAT repeat protein
MLAAFPALARLLTGGPLDKLAFAIAVLTALVAATGIWLAVHHAYSHARQVRIERRMAAAAEILIPGLADPDSLRACFDRAVARTGPRSVAAVLRQLRRQVSGEEARKLSVLLEEVGEVGRLERLSRFRRAWLRVVASRALGECGGARAEATLARLATDRNPLVRQAARHTLVASEREDLVDVAVSSFLADAPEHRRASFFPRLAAFHAARLRELLASGRLDVMGTKQALEALGYQRDRASAPSALTFVDSADPELRASAVRVLGLVAPAEHWPQVLARLADEVWFVRACAARALAGSGPASAVEEGLGRALQDPYWWVRVNAARTLARRGEAGVRELLGALSGPDRYAHDAALSALATRDALELVAGPLRAVVAASPRDPLLVELLANARQQHA